MSALPFFSHLISRCAQRGTFVAIVAGVWLCGAVAHAGNSLRGGAMASPKGSSSSAASTSQTATAATDTTAQNVQSSATAQHAQASFTHSLQALQALQAAQAAARTSALNGANNLGLVPGHPTQTLPNVPDGLGTGALMPTGGLTKAAGTAETPANTTSYKVPVSWTSVGGLSQAANPTTGNVVDTVTQTKQQALLYWNSFNIGKKTTLSFDQSAGGANVSQWVAINQITDSSLHPSQILGAITAPGQVYVINQNGIIFGGSSQVNVGALTASSLQLNPAYINNGLLNDAGNNFQFQFSSLFTTSTTFVGKVGHKTAVTTVAPLWTTPPAVTTGGSQTVSSVPTGDITVQAGAQLSSPTNAEHQGGRIALIAPNVTNAGTISTPDGQTILAAGLQVGLAAHNSNDASLRGLDVYVGQVQSMDSTLPVGTFTFNGLANGNKLTFAGTGEVGNYTAPDGSVGTINGGSTVAIPVGSVVNLNDGAPSFTAFQGGVVTNAANTLNAQGVVTSPGGDIEAPRADVMLEGATVNQLGVINGSTSVTLNGRIDLLADYNAAAGTSAGKTSFFAFAAGTVNMGGQSVTQILPELSSTATTIGTTLPVSSLVNTQGSDIEMQPGSLLLAPGASKPSSSSSAALDLVGAPLASGVTLNAGTWFSNGNQVGISTSTFSNSTGQIALGAGSVIDVSGSENVNASVAENIIPVQLRGPELADSPLQREGSLRGATVYVDIRDAGVYNGQDWIGTPIGNVAGYVNDVQRTAGELTTAGGTVALNAGTSVSTGAGAVINVSGGWINYAAATVQTTKILANGEIINLSQATPNLAYQGTYKGSSTTSTKWGVTQTFINSLVTGSQADAGYLQGGNGGAISITAPSMTLNGNLYGNTVSGAYQRTAQSSLATTYSGASFLPTTLTISGVPQTGALAISFLQTKVGAATNVYSATSSNVTFQSDDFISANTPAANELFLSQDIVNTDGFGKLTIDTSAGGTISVPAGIALTTSPGGMISFAAANIDIEGSIAVPGGGSTGGMTFTVSDSAPSIVEQDAPVIDPTRGHFILGANALLSSSGLVVDDRITSAAAGTVPFLTSGGGISIAALEVDLMRGSSIDVSGGAAFGSGGAVTYGNAGSLSVLGGQDPAIPSLVNGGQLILGSTMTGYSGNVGGGGTLTVQSALVQIGGTSLLNGDASSVIFTPGETGVASNGTTLWLNGATGRNAPGDFFSQGGFGNFNIEGLGQIQTDPTGAALVNAAGNPIISPAVLITSNTVISPIVQKLVATTGFDSSGSMLVPLTVAQSMQVLPSQRTAANLAFNAEGVLSFANSSGGGDLMVRGDLVMQAGAKIVTDPQTNSSHGVSLLAGRGTVAVLGSIIAPGGAITVKGGNTSSASAKQLLFFDNTTTDPFPTVDLGPNSILSTAGTTEQTANSLGFYTGNVLPGGRIAVTGNIVAEKGATLDVSGATDVLNESAAMLGGDSSSLATLKLTPTRVDSNAGSITFSAAQLFYSDATLLGNAGGPSAQGGSLSLSSGFATMLDPSAPPPSPLDVTVIVSQKGLNGGYSLPSSIGTGVALLQGKSMPGADSAVGATVNSAIAGQPVDSYFAASTNLFSTSAADATASNNGGKAGGFASLNLAGTLDFVGKLSITTARSMSLAMSSGSPTAGETGGVIYADSAVVLTSPYVALNIDQASFLPDVIAATDYPAASAGSGSLKINASTLVDIGNLSLQNISTVSFNSGIGVVAGDIRGNGTLQGAGQINLNAAQIYPTSAATFTIKADDVSISKPANQTLPSLPLSAGGTLNISANTIEQGGVLRAPFGVINLGASSTQDVTLSAGGITSVSGVDPTTGVGVTIPYGIVNDNGVWFDPNGNDISLSGPPAKAVNVAGQNIQIKSGSMIDVTGGGNLFGYRFTAGTGGSQDILGSNLTGFASNSFAIVPTYSLAYAPVGTYAVNSNLLTNNAQDIGYFNSSLAVGEQIHLNASKGLPAGDYTLLPARYALLPGAFLVSPGSGGAPGSSLVQPDGSSLVSGYVANGLNPASSLIFGSFVVNSQVSVLQRAPYTIDLATTYFPASAASHNLSTPRLPIDSGQLVLDAGQTMSIQGTLLSQAAQGGLGGEVDIASPEDIYVVGPHAADVPTGALVLDSTQLTEFGAASLLIGGIRTTTGQGTSVTVTTGNLVVDNSGASTTIDGKTVAGLAAPDIILVSNANLDVADNASIEQFGNLPGAAQTLTLQGDGVLLRVSSDSSAQIVRQNVGAGDSTSLLNIGQGVTIRKVDGTAAGSLTLDSTALVQISPSTSAPPVLISKSLTLDSSLINLELSAPATAPTAGLVITAPQLDSLLASTQSLSLLSYSSIAIYGSDEIGGVTTSASGAKTYQEANLALHASDIYYADTQDFSGVTINAQTVSLDNLSGGSVLPTLTGLGTSNLAINARTVSLGSGAMSIDQFTHVAINADSAILLRGLGSKAAGSDVTPTAASVKVGGDLTLTTPLITSAAKADQSVSDMTTAVIDMAVNATGALITQAPSNAAGAAPASSTLGASLSLSGSSIAQNSGSIVFHSGSLALQATGVAGSAADVTINGTLDVSGVAPTFYNLTKFTNGGQIALGSLGGNVEVGSSGLIDVAAASGTGSVDSGAGNGGNVTVKTAGSFVPGKVEGAGGTVTQVGTGAVLAQGVGGGFSLDAGSLTSTSGDAMLSSIEGGLTGFATQSIRDRTDATVTVDGIVKASSFNLSADAGSIVVAGTIDASNLQAGSTGGNISLEAGGSVTTQAGSLLTVAASQLNNAGQGGAVTLEAGAYEGAAVTSSNASINLGGQLDLSVAGGAGGTLHLRAPQVSGGAYVAGTTYTPVTVNAAGGGSPTDVAIAPIAGGLIKNASSVIVEGFYAQDAQQGSALIDGFEANAESNATALMSQAATIETRLFASSPTNVHIRPGEEIDNSQGSLELQSSWDLSSLRYGAPLVDGQGNAIFNAAGSAVLAEPGILTIRAAGDINLDFGVSLTDGFDGSAGVSYMNALMPVGSQSWAYHIASGADFAAANAQDVQSTAQLQSSGFGGSVQVGYQNSSFPTLLSNFNTNSQVSFFQTIRTGSGDIAISAGGDVLLLNNLATIYTAGVQVDGTLGGTFTLPSGTAGSGAPLPATYSSGGGSVTITAQGNIAHETYSADGTTLVADSSAELPTNWLDRQGSVSNGQVVLPTSWWVDFTNFFEGVGALGGGNVALNAGGSVVNVDAAVPTNARQVNGQLTELGGGDLTVRAGNNIDAGVYYVERGQGALTAGNDIQSNVTRAAVTLGQPSTPIDWLPTSFFLGKGTFTINANGNLLLGPTASPFLLPQSFNNIASQGDLTSELSYFSTYAPTDAVNASSLAGEVNIQDYADVGEGSLYAWYTNVLDANALSPAVGVEASAAQPWLLLAEATNPQHVIADFGPGGILALGAPANVFGGVTALLPPTLRVSADSGDINLIGTLTLAPAAGATVNLVAAGSINAFQVNNVVSQGNVLSYSGSGLINLSDTDPNALPGVNSPFSAGSQLASLVPFFTATGATSGLTLEARQQLHADINGGSLHANDPNPDPVYIYANNGDISGLTLFSAKQAQVIAGQDISDVGLYIQNNRANDISLVEAGRDILAYDASSPLRQQAGTNLIGYDSQTNPIGVNAGAPNTGDIQISGPGTLEVLAGRNLTLGNDAGANPNNTSAGDGLYTGLTSVGGQLNPSLPFAGANIVAVAGTGSALSTGVGLQLGSLNFAGFISQFINPASALASTYLPDVASLLGMTGQGDDETWAAFENLDAPHQNSLALDLFNLVLRDAGRNHNLPDSAGFGNYNLGYEAISALFPASNSYQGDINVSSREIKTSNGGDINLVTPGGGLTVGVDEPSGQAVDQGILTVDGGNISIFANKDVSLGTSRIFTLHGGNEIIWSTVGNIDAGASSKTVVSAPPTRVVVDPTSGSVQTDLAGLSTGGGIGVLASVAGVAPGDIDLIAPVGTVDAGDAGIRASGKLNIAAAKVANSDNISAGGGTTGVPAAASANIGALSAASSAAGSSAAAAQGTTPGNRSPGDNTQDLPSIVTVEVIGYGGGDQD